METQYNDACRSCSALIKETHKIAIMTACEFLMTQVKMVLSSPDR